jgi:hypothetical protein
VGNHRKEKSKAYRLTIKSINQLMLQAANLFYMELGSVLSLELLRVVCMNPKLLLRSDLLILLKENIFSQLIKRLIHKERYLHIKKGIMFSLRV